MSGTKRLMVDLNDLEPNVYFGRRQQIKVALHNHGVAVVPAMKRDHSPINAMTQPA